MEADEEFSVRFRMIVNFAGSDVLPDTVLDAAALVGMPPSTYRRHETRATAGMPPCVAKQVTRPIRNREAPVTEPQLA